MLAQHGIEPILQLACRDRNRIALQGDLMGAAALGIRNLLLLRGDDPKAGDQPDAKPVFDLDSTRADRDGAGDARRRRAADRHARSPASAALLHRRRRRAGRSAAGLAADEPRRQGRRPARSSPRPSSAWMPAWCAATLARLAEAGLRAIFLLIGVNPLRSAKSARWMKQQPVRHHHPGRDDRAARRGRRSGAEGRRICVELIEELATHPGRRRRAHHGAGQRRGGAGGASTQARRRLPATSGSANAVERCRTRRFRSPRSERQHETRCRIN